MTRDSAEAVKQDRTLTSDELDAVSGGRKAGSDPSTTEIHIESFKGPDAYVGGGRGAGKIIGVLVG